MKYWMFKMKSWNVYRQEAGDHGDPAGGGGGTGGDPDPKPEPKGDDPKADDKPKISDAEAKLLKDVMKKKEALEAANSALAEANTRLKEFEGLDPAEIKKLLAEKKTAEEAQLAAAGEFETLKKRMGEEHTRVTSDLQKQIAELQAQLQSKEVVIENLSVGQRFAQSPFIAGETVLSPDMARKLYGDHFDVVNGEVVAFDKKRGVAGRTALVDQVGNHIGFEDAMRKILEADPDKDRVLKSKVKQGAGSKSDPTAKPIKQEEAKDSLAKIGAGLASLLKTS